MTAVAVRGVGRAYPGRSPVTALDQVDLDVPSGALTAVLGPSGCGKTTLLRILAGFDRPDAGTVTFDGEVVSRPGRSVPPERRRVGIVPQEGALFPHLDVAANVAFGLAGGGWPGRWRRGTDRRAARVAEVLALVGLEGLEGRRPHELSGGQQQRVALARALAPEPAVVLLDEPFAALDAGLRDALRRQVVRTLRRAGATAVLVTHDQGEAMSMADHLAVMRAGRVVQAGAPAEVYLRPVDVEVARFLGEAVLLPGRARSGAVECVLGVVPADHAVEPGAAVTVCLRPEQVVRGDGGGAGQEARVAAVQYLGHDVLVDLVVGDGVAVRARWSSVELPAVGDVIGVRVQGRAVVLPVG